MGFACTDIVGLYWTKVSRGCQLGIRRAEGATVNFLGFREKVRLATNAMAMYVDECQHGPCTCSVACKLAGPYSPRCDANMAPPGCLWLQDFEELSQFCKGTYDIEIKVSCPAFGICACFWMMVCVPAAGCCLQAVDKGGSINV